VRVLSTDPPQGRALGSATEAGVPEFMDFSSATTPIFRPPLRAGSRGSTTSATTATARLRRLRSGGAHGRAGRRRMAGQGEARARRGRGLFNRFRRLHASGFFSSRIGVQEPAVRRNGFISEWKGCPPEALAKLGVTY